MPNGEIAAKLSGVGTSKDQTWPFADPRNVAVFTVKQIVRTGEPILWVTHDSDGAWQFHTGGEAHMEDGMVVCLAEIFEIDPTIKSLADLPLGWRAWRDSDRDDWQRGPHSEER